MALDFPANPADGEVFGSYIWSASKGVWQSREESAAPAIMSPTRPLTGTPGDIWVNTADGTTFVYYDDGSSAQWIELTPSPIVDISSKANLDGGNSFTGVQSFATPLAVSSGGTGATTLSTGSYLKGAGTGAITAQAGIPAGDITSGTIDYSRFPAGSVLQVVQTVDETVTSIATSANDTFLTYSKLNTTVTPKKSGSKFLVRFQINIGTNGPSSYRVVLNINGVTYGTTATNNQRASSNSIYLSNSGLPGDATIAGYTGEYLFQNSGTSNVAVSFQIFRQTGNLIVYVNRSFTYDDVARGRPASWVTIQEIAS